MDDVLIFCSIVAIFVVAIAGGMWVYSHSRHPNPLLYLVLPIVVSFLAYRLLARVFRFTGSIIRVDAEKQRLEKLEFRRGALVRRDPQDP